MQCCLELLRRKNVFFLHLIPVKMAHNFQIKLVNIRPEDIVEGNGKLTLGLIWTIILNFQVSAIIYQQQRQLQAPIHDISMRVSATTSTQSRTQMLQQTTADTVRAPFGTQASHSVQRTVGKLREILNILNIILFFHFLP